MKRIAIFLSVLLCSASMFAASTVTIDEYKYVLDESKKTAEVKGHVNYAKVASIVIPSQITYNGKKYRVTSIGQNAFNGAKNLKSVVISEGVTQILYQAFMKCEALPSIKFPQSLTTIGDYAFQKCNSLTAINIPVNVSSLSDRAFMQCGALTTIEVASGNKNFVSVGNVVFNKTKTKIVLYPAGREGEYAIPNGVTSFDAAFRGSKISRLVIPNSVTAISKSALSYCENITALVIPKSVTNIGGIISGSSCLKMTSIEVDPQNPKYASLNGMLYNKNLTELIEIPGGYQGEIQIPDKVTSISRIDIESYEGITSFVVSSRNQTYSSVDGVLYNKQKTEFYFAPKGIQGHIVVPEGVTALQTYHFKGRTKLSSVVLPNSLKIIGNSAFSGCTSLTSVVIPKGVTKIDNCAFERCANLTSVVMQEGVTSIGYNAFAGCPKLTKVVMPKGIDPSIGKDVFGGVLFTAFIPCGELEKYRAVSFWSVQTLIETTLDFVPNLSAAVDSMGTVDIVTYPDCKQNQTTIEAIPNAGYHFVKWSDGNTVAKRKIVLTPQTVLVAEFALGSAPSNTLHGIPLNEYKDKDKVNEKQKINEKQKVDEKQVINEKQKDSEKDNTFNVKKSIDVQKNVQKSIKK